MNVKTNALTIGTILVLAAANADAGIRRIWAVNDGTKIERDARDDPSSGGNSAWDGRVVRLFGARNEIVAFQVIVEADGEGIRNLSLRLPALVSATDRITYNAPASDPTDYVDRPIQIFTAHYMEVKMPSNASWIYERGSPAAPTDPTGWKPVQLVPENAHRQRGGLPVVVPPDNNQSIWIEIYIDRTRAPGVYRGTIEIDADGEHRSLPVELEVFAFTLPDENTMHAMLYYESDQPELYHGRNLDAAYNRLAHRFRVELVHGYDEQSATAAWGRFSGADFTRDRGYEGPGAGVGNVIAPRSFYGAGRDFEERPTAWAR